MSPSAKTPLTKNQVRGFWASWAGWALDGMDSFIYALVLVPAMRELLPKSGIRATAANTGFYGGLLFALFLVGWGLALIWGPVADRFGRVRTLAFTILCYSLFTFLAAFGQNIWEVAICRLLAGVGIGGEWAMGGTFVAEEWPEDRRKMGAGYMHTGYYFGFFLAALANHFVGENHGWRPMFMIGGAPAILIGLILYSVHEPERWKARVAKVASPFVAIFNSQYLRRTLLNSAYVLISIIGLWAGTVYVPTGVNEIAGRMHLAAGLGPKLATYATMVISLGTIVGCLPLPLIAERFGRRKTLAMYFVIMAIAISASFGWAFYLPQDAMTWFFVGMFFLGVGGANFAMYTLWLPEQYPTTCRGSAFAFATSVGRFVGAGFSFMVGAGVAHFHTIGIPVALTAIPFVLGLFLLPFGLETTGQRLPD
ncbi:MAG TPA: MFS transporter [Candidatus Acidoferrum sp.]|jgi:MFS family permease|nr:MFS transporter [Candidatus Acidoferrum sp.]